MDIENFGKRIDECMKKQGFSNKEVTEELKLSKNIIGNCKKNQIPNSETLFKLSQKFGVTMEYLLTGKESNNDLNLNENEQEMLEKFKKLPDREQIKVIGIVEERLEKYCKIEQSKESCEIEQQSLTSKIG